MPTRANSSSFETFTESHYSQTKDPPALPFIMFETFTESHYSQTSSGVTIGLYEFEAFTESHYSQTVPTANFDCDAFEAFTESHYSQTISCNPYEPEDIHRIYSCFANIVLKNNCTSSRSKYKSIFIITNTSGSNNS